jgi:hypothetical protein
MRPASIMRFYAQACLHSSVGCLLAQRSLKNFGQNPANSTATLLDSAASARATHSIRQASSTYASSSSADDLCAATLSLLLPQPHPPAESSSATQLKRSD